MPSTQSHSRSAPRYRIADYPALAALRLVDTDLDELKRQGKICAERRQQRLYFKLRFRRRGKQVVRYVGNAESAGAVASELQMLQARVTARRKLTAITRLAGQMLRNAKTRLEPILEMNGFVFHGMSIRRARQRTADTFSSSPDSQRKTKDMTMNKPDTEIAAAAVPAPATETSDIASAADRHEAGLRRVLDYQTSALKKDNALDAVIATINGGLMRFALVNQEVIEQHFESGPRSLERLQEVQPAIDTHLRVTRQVDRFAQFEIRSMESAGKVPPGKEPREPKQAEDSVTSGRPDAAPPLAITQSEESAI